MTASTEASPDAVIASRMPDFFVVGHPKCGTTALYEMLRRHPQIFMPDFKEPWFFAEDMRPRFQPARSGTVPETLEAYLALFASAGPDMKVGEASSSYLRSHTAAARIAQLRPDAKVIAILREPASFLRSLHDQMLRDHIETEKDLAQAISLEGDRREGRKVPRRSHLPQMLLYSDHVRYVEQLRRYHAGFPPEQVLVLIYDDFRADNEATLRRVHRFLGVSADVAVEPLQANASGKRMRSQRLDDLVNSVAVGRGPLSRAVKGGVQAISSPELRGRARRTVRQNLVLSRPAPPDERLMLDLRRKFKDEVAAVSEYLDRDLVTLWGYGELLA
ncbi:MAG: sulfotransferase family protein [Solirubrobacteraceae bacterium]